MPRAIGWIWLALTSLSTAAFGLLYYQGYWRWRGCFNEEGRCWDGVVVHHQQNEALIVPLLLSAFGLLAGLWLMLGSKRRLERETS